MKKSISFTRFLMLGVVFVLALSACEKPTPGAEEQETLQQTQEASQPTEPVAPPVDGDDTTTEQPADGGDTTTEQPVDDGDTTTEQPADDGDTTTEQPADGDTAVAVDPTVVPDAGGDPATDPQAGGGTGDDVPETAVTPVPTDGTYTVSAGENFFRIGLNHGCTVGQMAAANSDVVPPNYIIYIGQSLVIPDCN